MASDVVIAERVYQIDGIDVALRIYAPFLARAEKIAAITRLTGPNALKEDRSPASTEYKRSNSRWKMADTDLRYSDAYKSGRLTLFDERDLHLPTLDVERPPMKLAYAIKFIADMDKA